MSKSRSIRSVKLDSENDNSPPKTFGNSLSSSSLTGSSLSGSNVVMSKTGKVEDYQSSRIIDDDSDNSSVEDVYVSPKKNSYQKTKSMFSIPKDVNSDDFKQTRSIRSSVRHEDAIEEELVKYNYTPIDKIIIDGKNGEKTVKLILATNSIGDYVGIIPNDKSVSYDRENGTVVRKTTGEVAPSSLKIDIANCAGKSSCGALYSCDGKFCVLNRSDDGNIEEENFVITEEKSDKTIKIGSLPVAIPIITMDEISIDKDGVIENGPTHSVKKATQNINNLFVKKSMTNFNTILKEIEEFTENLNIIKNNIPLLEESRSREVSEALSKLDTFKNTTTNENNQHSEKEIHDYLVTRSQTSVNVKSVINVLLSKYTDVISELKNDSETIKNTLFVTARKDYDPEVSKKVMLAKTWGLPDELDKLSSPKEIIEKSKEKNASHQLKSVASVLIEVDETENNTPSPIVNSSKTSRMTRKSLSQNI